MLSRAYMYSVKEIVKIEGISGFPTLYSCIHLACLLGDYRDMIPCFRSVCKSKLTVLLSLYVNVPNAVDFIYTQGTVGYIRESSITGYTGTVGSKTSIAFGIHKLLSVRRSVIGKRILGFIKVVLSLVNNYVLTVIVFSIRKYFISVFVVSYIVNNKVITGSADIKINRKILQASSVNLKCRIITHTATVMVSL